MQKSLRHHACIRILIAMLSGVVALIMPSCSDPTVVYDHYCPTPVEGWEPGDELKFHIDTLCQAGNYTLTIGVRTSMSIPYPYQSLTILMQQRWHNPERVLSDTLVIPLTNERGDASGYGVSYNQSDTFYQTLTLPAGTSADITIHHLMRSEMLQGVSDVGLRLELLGDDVSQRR